MFGKYDLWRFQKKKKWKTSWCSCSSDTTPNKRLCTPLNCCLEFLVFHKRGITSSVVKENIVKEKWVQLPWFQAVQSTKKSTQNFFIFSEGCYFFPYLCKTCRSGGKFISCNQESYWKYNYRWKLFWRTNILTTFSAHYSPAEQKQIHQKDLTITCRNNVCWLDWI